MKKKISADMDDLINSEIYNLIRGYRTVDEISYVNNPSDASYIFFVNENTNNIHIRENIYKKPSKRIFLKNLGSYKKVKNENTDTTCSICLQELKKNEMYRELNCNHIFHKKCIDNWLYSFEKKNCPLCRVNLKI